MHVGAPGSIPCSTVSWTLPGETAKNLEGLVTEKLGTLVRFRSADKVKHTTFRGLLKITWDEAVQDTEFTGSFPNSDRGSK